MNLPFLIPTFFGTNIIVNILIIYCSSLHVHVLICARGLSYFGLFTFIVNIVPVSHTLKS